MNATEEIHKFWFGNILEDSIELPERLGLWFFRNEKMDEVARERFSPWLKIRPVFEDSAKGDLAHLLLLDQIPRNAFRGKPGAFAFDEEALILARRLIELPHFHPLEKMFIALPFQHSELLRDQRISLETFRELLVTSKEDLRPFFRVAAEKALQHFHAIQRFQRFPHRNQILGRSSSAAEAEFLTDPKAWF